MISVQNFVSAFLFYQERDSATEEYKALINLAIASVKQGKEFCKKYCLRDNDNK